MPCLEMTTVIMGSLRVERVCLTRNPREFLPSAQFEFRRFRRVGGMNCERGKTKEAEKCRSPKKLLWERRAFPPLLFPLSCKALNQSSLNRLPTYEKLEGDIRPIGDVDSIEVCAVEDVFAFEVVMIENVATGKIQGGMLVEVD